MRATLKPISHMVAMFAVVKLEAVGKAFDSTVGRSADRLLISRPERRCSFAGNAQGLSMTSMKRIARRLTTSSFTVCA